jgi:hypothetical protein
MSPEVDISGWPSEAQVAAMLGVSERTLRREAAKGQWQTRARQRPGKKSETVYNPDQVAARMPPPPSSIVRSKPDDLDNQDSLSELAEFTPVTWPAVVDLVRTLLAELQPVEPQPQKRFVTAKQAAEIAGLSEGCIRRMMREGKLPYLTDHNAWMTSLDAVESFDPFAAPKKTRKRE